MPKRKTFSHNGAWQVVVRGFDRATPASCTGDRRVPNNTDGNTETSHSQVVLAGVGPETAAETLCRAA